MKTRILILLYITGIYACEPGRPPSVEGMWQLLKFEQYDSGVWSVYPWNSDGTGYLLYSKTGYASLHITPKDYGKNQFPKISEVDTLSGDSVRSVLKIIMGNYNYMASYKVDALNQVVTHTRLSHSRPEDWGKTVERRYELKGSDTLLLFPLEGDKPRRLTWVRMY